MFNEVTPATGAEEDATSMAVNGARDEGWSIYLDEESGVWRCRHCSWTYQLLGSAMDIFQKRKSNFQEAMEFETLTQATEDDCDKPTAIVDPFSSKKTSQKRQLSVVSIPPTAVMLPEGDVQIHRENQILVETKRENEWDILKSIVYGGLIESIISLCVISSAAGANTPTLNVVAMGFASLIGGLFVMIHYLAEIKNSASANQNSGQADRYWMLLGRRENFRLHATISVASYVLFGLLPPLIYAFLSRENVEKEFGLIIVAAASLACIALLAIGKAHPSAPSSYFKYLLYYVGLGFAAGGLSYMAGVLIDRFLAQLHLFERDALVLLPPSVELFRVGSAVILSSSW
ncbi:hypothetical protein KSP40_PGU016516 [Platanthera guangdongensis]|uniref:Membrane protein of ER body-like protein n=1 Tax=Platanthera guangdongensis TaxID=2320717 RepID=A0ABR2ME62_9ASPA